MPELNHTVTLVKRTITIVQNYTTDIQNELTREELARSIATVWTPIKVVDRIITTVRYTL